MVMVAGGGVAGDGAGGGGIDGSVVAEVISAIVILMLVVSIKLTLNMCRLRFLQTVFMIACRRLDEMLGR